MTEGSKGSLEFLAMMASILSKEQLVKFMLEACTEYQANPSDANFGKINALCAMMGIKGKIEISGGLKETLKDLENFFQREKLFDVSKSKS